MRNARLPGFVSLPISVHASVELIEREKLPEKAGAFGKYFMEGLKALKTEKIREVRGLGLMIGIELKEKAGPYVQAVMENGVIVLLAGANVIRLLPPLVITKEEIGQTLKALREVLS